MSSRLLPTLLLCLGIPGLAPAQQWTSGADLPLIQRAVAQRTIRDADTLLASWQAMAHGIVRMATIVDQGTGPSERLIKLDELTVEVYGEIPSRSKQVIRSWRDTSYLPNAISYHRDHLGIVANDFGGTIRLGNGEEVRNLVHPLSPAGLDYYLFSPGDTLTIDRPLGKIRVNVVQVRPRNPDAPGTVGTLYLDTDRAALVRFRFTFTPRSYIDRTVRDITVSLESSLLENARWLPWRQSIVIRREDAFLELPMHTVLRADWELDDYQLGVHHPPDRFAGVAVQGPLRALPTTAGEAPIGKQLEQLPVAEFNVDAIQAAASAMLDGRLLNGLPLIRSYLDGYSDLLRVNRVEGITVSYGLHFPIGAAVSARVKGGFGFSDDRIIGTASLEGPLGTWRWSAGVGRTMRDVVDQPVTSALYNTITTAIDGSDHGDWTLIERAGIALDRKGGLNHLSVEAAHERSTSVVARFSPIHGTSRLNPALGTGDAEVGRIGFSRLDAQGRGVLLRLEGGAGDADWLRASAALRVAAGRWRINLSGGGGTTELPGYRSFVAGGTGSMPGMADRSIGGRRLAQAELGFEVPVSVPLPVFGFLPYARFLRRVHLPSALTPFVAAGIAGGAMASVPWQATGAVETVAGLRLDLWGAMLRVETGISLRHGGWGLSLDLHPDWWPLF